MKNKVKIPLIIASCVLGICIILASVYGILYLSGKSFFGKNFQNINADSIEVDDNEITYKNTKYTLNKNIISALFIGVDKDDINDSDGYGQNGQADTLFVMALDTKTGEIKILPISRETMVDIDVYSSTGIYSGVENEQVCLAYAYGNTAEESCENVLKSVKRILYGININGYVAVDLNGIGEITEKIGGVEVVALEDVSTFGLKCKKGDTINLKGTSAIHYIQTRSSDLDSNAKRMEKQKQFLSSMATAMGNKIIDDYSNILTYYNTLSPYLSTNLSLSQITYIATNFLKSDIGSEFNYKIVDGEHIKGEEYIEFHPDEDELLDAIIDIFYIKKAVPTK